MIGCGFAKSQRYCSQPFPEDGRPSQRVEVLPNWKRQIRLRRVTIAGLVHFPFDLADKPVWVQLDISEPKCISPVILLSREALGYLVCAPL
jgi:hypothetical protein